MRTGKGPHPAPSVGVASLFLQTLATRPLRAESPHFKKWTRERYAQILIALSCGVKPTRLAQAFSVTSQAMREHIDAAVHAFNGRRGRGEEVLAYCRHRGLHLHTRDTRCPRCQQAHDALERAWEQRQRTWEQRERQRRAWAALDGQDVTDILRARWPELADPEPRRGT